MVIVDGNLSWHHHIHELRKKLNRANSILSRLRNYNCPKTVLLSVFHALFMTHATYGICAWGSAKSELLDILYLAQKRALRIITKSKSDSPTSELFKDLGILKIKDLYAIQLASFMFDFDNGLLPKYFKHFLVEKETLIVMKHTILMKITIFLRTNMVNACLKLKVKKSLTS